MNRKQQAPSSTQRVRRSFFIAACCLLPAACCFAAEPPTFAVQTTRDDLPAGPLMRFTADGAVQLGAGPAIAGAEVVAIHRQGLPPPLFPQRVPHVRLANGDRIPGRLIGITGDKLHLLADIGTSQEIDVPMSAVSAVWLTDSAAAWAATPAGARMLAEKRRTDVVQMTNGDTVTGTIAGWAADGPLRLDADGREVSLPRARVQSLMFSTELARVAKPRSAYWLLVLVNGARLSVKTAELVGEELRATTLTGAEVRIPLRALAAINVYHGRAVYLSDLKPQLYQHTRYLGVEWPLAVDRSVSGGDLQLGGGTYDKGLGMHSRSRVTYPLPAGVLRFEAVVGLDDLTGRSGAVLIDVLTDGKSLFPAPPVLAGTDPPRSLRLTLPQGAHVLMLVVDYGRGGDVQDQVDWADARVIVGDAAGP